MFPSLTNNICACSVHIRTCYCYYGQCRHVVDGHNMCEHNQNVYPLSTLLSHTYTPHLRMLIKPCICDYGRCLSPPLPTHPYPRKHTHTSLTHAHPLTNPYTCNYRHYPHPHPHNQAPVYVTKDTAPPPHQNLTHNTCIRLIPNYVYPPPPHTQEIQIYNITIQYLS